MPTEANFDDQTCQMMRALFGLLLTTCGSGSAPLSHAFQLVRYNPPLENPPPHQLFIYSAIVQYFPYTAWKQDELKKNVDHLTFRLVRNRITNGVTAPMNQLKSKSAGQKHKEYAVKKRRALTYAGAAVYLIQYLESGSAEMGQYEKKAVVERFLSTDGTLVSTYLGRYLEHLGNGDDIPEYHRQRCKLICRHLMARRGKPFRELLNGLLGAVDGEDPAKVTAILDKIEERDKTLAKEFDNEPLPRFGFHKFEDVRQHVNDEAGVPKVLRDQVSGDGSRVDPAWRVNNDDTDEPMPTVESLFKFATTGETMELISSSQADTTVTVVAAPLSSVLVQKLEKVNGSDKAVQLVKNVDTELTLEKLLNRFTMNKGQFELFFGGSQPDVVQRIKKCVLHLIEHWDGNTEIVDAQARMLLFGRQNK
jgi:hypothetical protein